MSPKLSLSVLSIFLHLAVMCVVLWSISSYTEVPFMEPSKRTYETKFSNGSDVLRTNKKTAIPRVNKKNTERGRKISEEDQIDKNEEPLPFLKITENTPGDITDIMGLPRIKFDRHYKNPCFRGYKSNPLFKDGNLHCLPYFYILGVKKSGTSDLYFRLANHREFMQPKYKECQWFPRIRFGGSSKRIKTTIDNRSVNFYITMFDKAAAKIKSCPSRATQHGSKNPCITADATPANFHMHTGWNLLPGNEGLTEPRYTNFHYIKHLTPHAKIIVIFRDPVTRLLSDFIYGKRDRNQFTDQQLQNMFHSQVLKIMKLYKRCFKEFTIRRCIFNETLLSNIPKEERSVLGKSFVAGFYAFFMKELFSVFPRNQILTINMKSYTTYMEKTLVQIFKFLKMSPLSSEDMKAIVTLQPANQSSRKITMLEKTRNMLYKFYKPFNKELAELLGDNSYLFKLPTPYSTTYQSQYHHHPQQQQQKQK